MSDIPSSRSEAKAVGAKHYFTGKPCPNGHNTIRFASTGGCNDCLKKKARDYNRKHKEDKADYIKKWRQENQDHVRRYNKEHHRKTFHSRRDHRLRYLRKHYEENKTYYREYRRENRKHIAAWARQRYKDRISTDPDFKASRNIRGILQRTLSLSGKRKDMPTEKMLGYSAKELRQHIERQFLKGMGWHNRSEWHIDHITPVSWFIKNGITDPKRINCLSNLRPIWAADNYRKKARRTTLL